mgnify:CR=1 FL=1
MRLLRRLLTGVLALAACATAAAAQGSWPSKPVMVIVPFSAGGNIKTMGERSKAAPHLLQQAYKSGIQRIPLAMQDAEIPVIAAVNGPAIGAGFDLANMCDIRIGSTNAQFGETFVNLGIIPGDGGACAGCRSCRLS